MFGHHILKLKIYIYEKEYLAKRDLTNPDTKTIIKMRKAISTRLKKEMNEVSQEHDSYVNSIKNTNNLACFIN